MTPKMMLTFISFRLDSGDMMFEQLEMDSREVSTHQKRIKLDSNKYQLVYGYHDHVTHNNI